MSWQYDEMVQTGVDFERVDQVEAYDAKQGSRRDEEQALCDRLRVGRGTRVVDLGCGTGSFAREAARGGADVRAVDVSRAMLDFVQREAEHEGLDSLRIEHAGFLSFEAPPSSADVVVTRFALHHLPDFWKQVALGRLASALEPGGCLYLRDVVFSFRPESHAEAVEAWVSRMPAQSGFTRDEFETHVRDEYSTYAWILEGMLERAGFEIVERSLQSAEYAEYICRPRGST